MLHRCECGTEIPKKCTYCDVCIKARSEVHRKRENGYVKKPEEANDKRYFTDERKKLLAKQGYQTPTGNGYE